MHIHSSAFAQASSRTGHKRLETSDHVARAISKATKTPSGSPLPRSYRSFFESKLVAPALSYITALAQLYSNSAYSMSLIVNAKEKGRATKRVDIRHIIRNKKDLLCILPGAAYMCLPFQKYTLPLVFSYVPWIIPSVLRTSELLELQMAHARKTHEARSRRVLKHVITSLKAIPATDLKKSRIIGAERRRLALVEKFENPDSIKEADLLEMYTFCQLHFNLLTTSSLLSASFGSLFHFTAPALFPKTRMLQWGDWIAKDDLLIRKDGVNSLSLPEMVEALLERGFTPDPRSSREQLSKLLLQSNGFSSRLLDIAHLQTRYTAAPAPGDVAAGRVGKPPMTFSVSDRMTFNIRDMAAVTMVLALSRATQ
ncbi:hypothetical protein BASA81_011939 [Batrachochytrium salamandrivorans]|nr:hypothetical protein BASA81_011939 [Batrachochytrium salamandrivorans]